MKERPVLLNAEMVRAVLDGRKTQTRQIVKNQREGECWSVKPSQSPRTARHTHDWWLPSGTKPYSALPACPLGTTGDRLWVRETWQGPLVDYDDAYSMFKDPVPFQKTENCVYRADGVPCPEFTDADDELRQGWRPSIHMPRWASRITLEITSVRVERLRDISVSDALAEGITSGRCGNEIDSREVFYVPGDSQPYLNTATAWRDLWSSLYGAESWQANPWVWGIEFKLLENADKAG